MFKGRQSDRAFGFMFAIIFAVIAGIVWFVSGRVSVALAGTSLAFALLALVWPVLLLPLNRLWQRLASGVGFVTNHVVLGLFFYLIITPVGLVMRMFGRNPMSLKCEPERETYFTAVTRHASGATFPDLF
jgi:hypothetical protein